MKISLVSNIITNVDGVISTVLLDNSDVFESANSNTEGYVIPEGTYLIGRSIEITVPISLDPGARFSIPEGTTLTISSGFSCGLHHCFTGDGDVLFKPGSVKEAYIQWFGAVSNNNNRTPSNDVSSAFNKALLCGAIITIPTGYYYLAHTVVLDKPCVLNFEGKRFYYDSYFPPVNTDIDVLRNNRALIYTDIDMDFFRIEARSVWIDGGTFDASSVEATQLGNRAAFRYVPQGWTSNVNFTRTNAESFGMRQGGITNILVIGNARKLIGNTGDGFVGIHIDWMTAKNNSYLYKHQWTGFFEHVKCAIFESVDGGNGASNSCWHDIDVKIWIGKQAVVLNRSTECNINVEFQSAPILTTAEKDIAPLYFKGVYGHRISAKFVDMLGTQFQDPQSDYYQNWSHFYTVEDWTGRNFYERTNTDVDITERQRKRVGGSTNGYTNTYADGMSGILPSGQFSGLYEGFKSAYYSNAIVAADKRYSTSVGYYKKPEGIPFTSITMSSAEYPCTPTTDIQGQFLENLWTAHTSFTEFFWYAGSDNTDYVEIVIDNIGISGIRYNELYLTGGSSIPTGGGIRQIHIVQIGNGPLGEEVVKNEVIDCEPAFVRSLRYSVELSQIYQVQRIIIRLIGLHYIEYNITSADLTNDKLIHPMSLANNTEICFTSIGTITGITTKTRYYVVDSQGIPDTNLTSFKVSLTANGDPIDLRGNTSSLPVWKPAVASFSVGDFAIFKSGPAATNEIYRSTAPLLAISGNQRIYGNLEVAGTTASPADHIVGDGSWNGTGLLRLGEYRLWVDSLGRLRMKRGIPGGENDGDIFVQQSP